MSRVGDVGLAEVALVGLLLAVAWVAYWFKLRRDAVAGGAEVDRYLLRTDLASGATPRNAAEWVIKLVTTRLDLVFGVLVGGALLGLLVGLAIEEDALAVTFAFLTVLFLFAAAFFIAAPHLEARLPGGRR